MPPGAEEGSFRFATDPGPWTDDDAAQRKQSKL
jgi:hypothetical protein